LSLSIYAVSVHFSLNYYLISLLQIYFLNWYTLIFYVMTLINLHIPDYIDFNFWLLLFCDIDSLWTETNINFLFLCTYFSLKRTRICSRNVWKYTFFILLYRILDYSNLQRTNNCRGSSAFFISFELKSFYFWLSLQLF